MTISKADIVGLRKGDKIVWRCCRGGRVEIREAEHVFGRVGLHIAGYEGVWVYYYDLCGGIRRKATGKSPLDIVAIDKVPEKLSGEFWRVVWQRPTVGDMVQTFSSRDAAVEAARKLSKCGYSDRVLAITNGNTWEEGWGLELLEEENA